MLITVSCDVIPTKAKQEWKPFFTSNKYQYDSSGVVCVVSKYRLKGGLGLSEILTRWMDVGKFVPYEGNTGTDPYLAAAVLFSGVLIVLSFYLMSIALALFTYKRRGTQPAWSAAMFAILAFAGGTTYLISIWMPWHPLRWLDAIVACITALMSIAAMIFVWQSVLKAVEPRPKSTKELHDVIRQLEHEVNERRRAEQALHKSQELLHQLVAYQERVKEDERKRIAREIHDELGQNLMALRIDVSVLQARIAEVHPTLNEKVRIALSHIDTSIKAVRIIINNLRPSVLDLGLHAAIEWQVNEFERRTGIACELTMDDEKSGFDLDDDRATALFRILQESLTNVARHAQASMVQIDLSRQDDGFCMTITDNGVGFFPGCRRKPNSFGLLGIGERISALGGEFAVESDPGQGTVLKVTIPVDAPVAMDG
jgi:signal transduction histidine kinase